MKKDNNPMKILKFLVRIVLGRPLSEEARKRETPKDPSREVAETIVFVIVLVLMLKLFVAEAFVIPTGSMASTLYGDQVLIDCPECGYRYPYSASRNQRQEPHLCCQNCGYHAPPTAATDINTGDRVLVIKYGYHFADPERFDVPVFKYPEEPFNTREKQSYNYIKRLLGLPNETLAIYHGDIYVAKNLVDLKDRNRFPADQFPLINPENQREFSSTYHNKEALRNLFLDDPKGEFKIFRKSPEQILTVRRLVFDNTHLPKSLSGKEKFRWAPADGETGWTVNESGLSHTGEKLTWIAYNHLVPDWSNGKQSSLIQPDYIRDHLSYNPITTRDNLYWTPDLMVETFAEIESAEAEIILELVKAGERFQAKFSKGKCELFRVPTDPTAAPIPLGEAETKINKAGKYHLRLANFDCRLTVWVDKKPLVFATQGDYPPPPRTGLVATELDRTEPVRIGSKGNVVFTSTQIYRDIMYHHRSDLRFPLTSDPPQYNGFDIFYIHPDHYLMLGDNSAASQDSRDWGLVPKRLILGKAVAIYWPLDRIGVIK